MVIGKRLTPLMVAIRDNNTEMVKLLVSSGADVNKKTEEGGTAINTAAIAGSKEITSYLLDKGADIESIDNEGKTS